MIVRSRLCAACARRIPAHPARHCFLPDSDVIYSSHASLICSISRPVGWPRRCRCARRQSLRRSDLVSVQVCPCSSGLRPPGRLRSVCAGRRGRGAVFTRPGRRLAGSSDARLGPMAMGAGGGRGPFGTDGCGSPFLRDRWLWESVPSGPMVVGARPFGTDGCGNPSLRDRWLWEPVPSGPVVV